jgi:uncharacterized protein (DUF427 family)
LLFKKGVGMARAIWQRLVSAQSDQSVAVEGNHYLPPEAVHCAYPQEGASHSAWYCPAARRIENIVAFWRGEEILL